MLLASYVGELMTEVDAPAETSIARVRANIQLQNFSLMDIKAQPGTARNFDEPFADSPMPIWRSFPQAT